MISESPAFHARNLVSQIVREDPEIAAALIRLAALADGSTPKGAAIRREALLYAYEFTEHCQRGLEAFMSAA